MSEVAQVKLDELMRTVSVRGHQVQTSAYDDGIGYPIVDQGSDLTVGRTEQVPPLEVGSPVTVFGDHTREVKYVDFPFVVGADGTKVLVAKNGDDPIYFNSLIAMGAGRIANLGYARHFKALREQEVPYLANQTEQRRIAAVLDAWDDAIATAERLVAAKRRRFEAMRNMLFARYDGRNMRFSELLTEAEAIPSNDPDPSKITVRLRGGGAVPKAERTAASGSTTYYRRRVGQLVYSKLDFLNGAFAILPPELDGYCTTTDLPAFDIQPTVRPDWLLHYLTRPTYYRRRTDLARGQRIARRVNPSDFLASQIIVPPIEQQDRVCECINELEGDLVRTDTLAQALRTQKRGLMQKLLTGEWRVPESIEHLVPEGVAKEAAE